MKSKLFFFKYFWNIFLTLFVLKIGEILIALQSNVQNGWAKLQKKVAFGGTVSIHVVPLDKFAVCLKHFFSYFLPLFPFLFNSAQKEKVAHCQLGNKTYLEGARYKGKSFQTCVCKRRDNDVGYSECKRDVCNTELYFNTELENYCAPVYYSKYNSCPVEMHCGKIKLKQWFSIVKIFF